MTPRDQLTAELVRLGHLDGPALRLFLRGERIETWRRSCRCPADCKHWECAGTRPAAPEEIAAFVLAQAPYRGRVEAAPEDVLGRLEDRYLGRYPAARDPEEMYP